jgi:hypothetical protein
MADIENQMLAANSIDTAMKNPIDFSRVIRAIESQE